MVRTAVAGDQMAAINDKQRLESARSGAKFIWLFNDSTL
jgi:hypothetical protein